MIGTDDQSEICVYAKLILGQLAAKDQTKDDR
jgi:hypothetical protein